MRRVLLILFGFLFFREIALPQDTMYIYQYGGGIIKIAVNEIDSITFYPSTNAGNLEVLDIDSNLYHTLTIGAQTWMVENLKTTRFSNGDSILTTIPATKDITNETNPKYQWTYEGNDSNVATYGRLYTWYAAADSRNICPFGWHVPSDSDWTTLMDYLGGLSKAGGRLKESGTIHWTSPNIGATNESSFTALPGGYRQVYGAFAVRRGHGYWWSATASNKFAWDYHMYFNNGFVYREHGYDNKYGFSVRCLKGH
jgi:uncharacterized protein (TIGR02145 family)